MHHDWRQEEEEEDGRGEREARAYVLPDKSDHVKFSDMTVGQARAYLSQILD